MPSGRSVPVQDHFPTTRLIYVQQQQRNRQTYGRKMYHLLLMTRDLTLKRKKKNRHQLYQTREHHPRGKKTKEETADTSSGGSIFQ